jgi:hypothetical protein
VESNARVIPGRAHVFSLPGTANDCEAKTALSARNRPFEGGSWKSSPPNAKIEISSSLPQDVAHESNDASANHRSNYSVRLREGG